MQYYRKRIAGKIIEFMGVLIFCVILLRRLSGGLACTANVNCWRVVLNAEIKPITLAPSPSFFHTSPDFGAVEELGLGVWVGNLFC
jgi:hypothetical protein